MKIFYMDKYHVRVYGRTELAQVYFPWMNPCAAYRKLMAWINGCPELAKVLKRLGNNPRRRTFTPAEVSAIFDLLGEPTPDIH